jgi:hypothetical protein
VTRLEHDKQEKCLTFALQCFPYDFRGEEIMSLVKHIVARCGANTQLGDRMSDILSALLIKLTELSQHEEEMKSYKKPLDEVKISIYLLLKNMI